MVLENLALENEKREVIPKDIYREKGLDGEHVGGIGMSDGERADAASGPDSVCAKVSGFSGKKGFGCAEVLALTVVLCALIGAIAWYGSQMVRTCLDKRMQATKTQAEASLDAASTRSGSPDGSASSTGASAVTAVSSAAASTKEQAEEVPIDFEEIRKDCPDVYAWICIPDTRIDYPICQPKKDVDPDFYLNHRADGTEEFAGAIYSQNYNSRDFTDPNTILYGHDMADGSMFQNLHLYEDRDFFEENREVIIYLPDRALRYRVFAAYNTTDEHILFKYDFFKDPAVFRQYLRDILDGTNMISGTVDDDVELTGYSRILTLSTCNAYENQRYLVQCVLEK